MGSEMCIRDSPRAHAFELRCFRQAGGVAPIELLRLLQLELGYQCFDLRCGYKGGAKRLAEFVKSYPAVTANEFGTWTDLLCTRFDLL